MLLVFDYDDWGGRSLYTAPANERVGLARPGTHPGRIERVAEAARLLGGLGVAWEMADPHWIEDKWPLRVGPDPVTLDGDPANDALASYEWARLGEPETRLFGVST
ncbi:MAG: hypothetical protein DCC71_03620 [Proteobacteria bacterium]|nr:MAG: hypothetical protein DCC71_03620 [Pseudomonadota bacterium]